MESGTAWAEGTHEYRPLGVAVVASTDLFRARDFLPKRRPPSRSARSFHGLFASLEAVNRHLRMLRSQAKTESLPRRLNRQMAIT